MMWKLARLVYITSFYACTGFSWQVSYGKAAWHSSCFNGMLKATHVELAGEIDLQHCTRYFGDKWKLLRVRSSVRFLPAYSALSWLISWPTTWRKSDCKQPLYRLVETFCTSC